MDNFQKAVWLENLSQLKQQTEDEGIFDLSYIFGVTFAALEQGELPRLKEQFVQFAHIKTKELEEQLCKLQEQMGDAIVQKAREIISPSREDFKLKKTHDDHFPFREDETEDQNT